MNIVYIFYAGKQTFIIISFKKSDSGGKDILTCIPGYILEKGMTESLHVNSPL